jgi:hypothetical protein
MCTKCANEIALPNEDWCGYPPPSPDARLPPRDYPHCVAVALHLHTHGGTESRRQELLYNASASIPDALVYRRLCHILQLDLSDAHVRAAAWQTFLQQARLAVGSVAMDYAWSVARYSLRECDEVFPWYDWAPLQVSFDRDDKQSEAFKRLPWRVREEMRLLSGAYEPLPWAKELEPIADHFAHTSIADSGLVAYTENANKGERDIQLRIKPGRYLTRFYPHLKPPDIQRLTAAFDKSSNLQFAITAEEIERVYLNGPSSCMTHKTEHYDGHVHPVHVYGNSDVQLAYIENSDGRAAARVLVWPERKVFSRVYGDSNRIVPRLQALGYKAGSLEGAKIRLIQNLKPGRRGIIMPYIDGCRSFDIVDDDWCRIGGDYHAEATNGIVETDGHTCEYCEYRSETVEYHEVIDAHACDECLREHTWSCECCGEPYSNDESSITVYARRRWTQDWCDNCINDHAFHCDAQDMHFSAHSFESVEMHDGTIWELEYFTQHGVTVDGVNYPEDEAPQPEEPATATEAAC